MINIHGSLKILFVLAKGIFVTSPNRNTYVFFPPIMLPQHTLSLAVEKYFCGVKGMNENISSHAHSLLLVRSVPLTMAKMKAESRRGNHPNVV